MNEQLHQVRSYMSARARQVRYRPVTGLPAAERFHQIERLVDELWSLANTLGVDLGRKPTIIYTGAPMSPPSVVLGRTSALFIETLATLHMTGVAPALTAAVHKLTSAPISAGTPNFTTILDETFSDDDTFQDVIH